MLTDAQREQVRQELDKVFSRARTRFLGPRRGSKLIGYQFDPETSVAGLYEGSVRAAGGQPDPKVLRGLLDVTDARFKAAQEQALADLLRVMSGSGHKTWRARLGGELESVWKRIHDRLAAVVETESTVARNVGGLDGIAQAAASVGDDDPKCYFAVVRDGAACVECVRLHLMPDRQTPRVWRLADLGHGYHRRGAQFPSVGGCHPNCRCTLTALLSGWGFRDGRASYVGSGHDEYAAQRG